MFFASSRYDGRTMMVLLAVVLAQGLVPRPAAAQAFKGAIDLEVSGLVLKAVPTLGAPMGAPSPVSALNLAPALAADPGILKSAPAQESTALPAAASAPSAPAGAAETLQAAVGPDAAERPARMDGAFDGRGRTSVAPDVRERDPKIKIYRPGNSGPTLQEQLAVFRGPKGKEISNGVAFRMEGIATPEVLTLRIKSFFFKKILSGEKHYEYRAVGRQNSALIEAAIKRGAKFLRLHFQDNDVQLLAEISAIDVVPGAQAAEPWDAEQGTEPGDLPQWRIALRSPELIWTNAKTRAFAPPSLASNPWSQDFYERIGANKEMTAAQLKSAYHRTASSYHPDLHATEGRSAVDEMTEATRKIIEAYDVLGDSAKKARYDRRAANLGAVRVRRTGPVRRPVPREEFNGRSFPSQVGSTRAPDLHLVRAIQAAKKSIRIVLDRSSSPNVVDALLGAQKAGVKVQIHFLPSRGPFQDRSESVRQKLAELRAAGLKVRSADFARLPKGARTYPHLFALFDDRLSVVAYDSHGQGRLWSLKFTANPDELDGYRELWRRFPRAL